MKYINILVLTETKLDDTFPTAHFLMKGFSEPCRLDRNRNWGGVMIYIYEEIPKKLLVNMFFHMICKVCLLNSILGNINGYFLKHTTHYIK